MLDTSKLGPKQKEWVEALLSGKYKQGRAKMTVNKMVEKACF